MNLTYKQEILLEAVKQAPNGLPIDMCYRIYSSKQSIYNGINVLKARGLVKVQDGKIILVKE